jgi:hypothetical protein
MAPGSRRSGSLEPLSSHARSLDPRVHTATPTRNFSQSHEPRALQRVLACWSVHGVRPRNPSLLGLEVTELLDALRSCSAFRKSTLLARNSRSLKATRRLEIADSASGFAQRYHCSVQLGVPKIPVPAFVQYCQLSRMSTSRAHKISLLPSL